MKYLIGIAALLILGFIESPKKNTTSISDAKMVGATPRFTTDHRGNPVLSWSEKDGEKNYFYFTISEDNGHTFGEKIKVNAPSDFSVHAEGMPKVAFKSDGTIYATFEQRRPTKSAPRAGDLLYCISKDKGQTWSTPTFVHQDTTAGKGHSFSDIIRLPNGELGLVWLDDKLSNYEGRSVKFVQTLPQGGFSKEIVLDSNACQCCRTVLFIDNKKQINITYRDLLPDGTRDMSIVKSVDSGKTFTQPTLIYKDGWKINACPHTGPSMAQVGSSSFVAWFSGKSATHEAGIRVVKTNDNTLFSSTLSIRAKHPQIAHVDGSLVIVWDESFEKNDKYFTKIALKTIFKDHSEKTVYLSPDFESATYPVLLATKNGLILAYERQKENQDKSVIVTQFVPNM